jgi:hypothetical protein
MAVALAGSPVFAQNAQNAYSPVGFKVGDGRLHLFAEVDTRFDSLVGRFRSSTTNDPEIIFTPRAGLSFGLENSSTLINFNANAEYLLFSGFLSPSSRALSRPQAFVGLDTVFNREGAVSVELGDTFARSDRTQNPAAGIGVISLFNSVYLGIPIRPGGRALEFTPRVTWGIEFFDPLLTGLANCSPTDITCNPALLSNMNYSNLNFALRTRYKFLPKTAGLLDVNFDYRTYFNVAPTNLPANVLRGRLGLVGLITPRFSATLLAGAAHDFGATRVTAPIGQAELTYLVGESTSLSLGYNRDLMPVPAFGVMSDDRGYFNARLSFFGDRLQLNGNVAVDFFTFFSQVDAMGTPGGVRRNDISVTGTVGPSFVVTSWFVVGASYALGFRTSPSNVMQSAINFVRHEALLRLTLRY